jgi:hypothetical protein
MTSTQIQTITSAVYLLNSSFKKERLNQIQFSIDEKHNRLSMIFTSSEGDEETIGTIEDFVAKEEGQIFKWFNHHLDNIELYKVLLEHYDDQFGSAFVDDPTNFLLSFEDILYRIELLDTEKHLFVVTGEIEFYGDKKVDIEFKDITLTIEPDEDSFCYYLEQTKEVQLEELSQTLESIKEALAQVAEQISSNL